jgi:SSS family solute:Na+ symporter
VNFRAGQGIARRIFHRHHQLGGPGESLGVGFVLGALRLILELDKANLAPGSLTLWYASINFLHFAALLFVLCTLILVIVSLATPPPAPERVADLTIETAKPAPADQATPAERRMTVVLSVVLVATIGVLWFIFR